MILREEYIRRLRAIQELLNRTEQEARYDENSSFSYGIKFVLDALLQLLIEKEKEV